VLQVGGEGGGGTLTILFTKFLSSRIRKQFEVACVPDFSNQMERVA
jgi:hypothetical protein